MTNARRSSDRRLASGCSLVENNTSRDGFNSRRRE